MRYPSAWLTGVTRGDSIACELRLQIIRGTIKPGEVISENRVAADYGASRSPVREAMKTLGSEGLIRLERMGAVVLGLSMKDLEELYDVRYLIESFAQKRLGEGGHEQVLVHLKQLIDKMELAVKYNDSVEFSHLDFTFHETMIVGAKHTRILHLWKSIRHIVLTVMLITTDEIFSQGEAKLHAVIEKHRTLVRAIETKDAAVIQQVVENYFADSSITLHTSIT
ncbi:GntR family transcriptional regulator [Paenibacillus taihuensis]|uniref:GntR family transcriptional regulator n=1 Tax=Paenibacillus taihuensis TaxID=1156355 RepID=A0A3D9QX04_9BACL|nr:GntR family transcriptional regulator [Paenibacillus taihuensis]REE68750.1 GntR family transcriptional regulator [Paenibacillus taihuensis]